MNDLSHFGVMGMKWGQRRATSRQSLSRSKGKTFLVEKDVFGATVSKTQITKKRAKEFLKQKQKDKAEELIERNARNQRVKKIASVIATAYSTYLVATIVAPGFTNGALRKVAWATGRVISNSPLR